MKDLEFPIFKTKMEGVTESFNLSDPVGRRKYFNAKADPEIEKLREYIRSHSFIAYFMGKKGAGKGTYSAMFREIVDEERPSALLGTFHNPWSDEVYEGARIHKLAIDLRAQAKYIDVFSPMPYHARFGHAENLDWISERVSWLGDYLNVTGASGEKIRIWPIVQLSDWGKPVLERDIPAILEAGSRSPATGVIVFAWGSLKEQPEKVDALWKVFQRMAKETVP